MLSFLVLYVNSPILCLHNCTSYVLFISSMQDVPHQTSASGAEYAVSSKATAHQYNDVKEKSPQGVRNLCNCLYWLLIIPTQVQEFSIRVCNIVDQKVLEWVVHDTRLKWLNPHCICHTKKEMHFRDTYTIVLLWSSHELDLLLLIWSLL